MRFDDWTKEKKQMLDLDYQQLFADQVLMMKQLYRFKSDKHLCDDILSNISRILFKLLEENHFEFVEALIERMFLSMISYDVIIYKHKIFEDYKIDLYFYDQYKIYKYKSISIMLQDDLKKMIELMLYIGRKYDQISLVSSNMSDITSQQLVLGFDKTFIENKMSQFYNPDYIQWVKYGHSK